MKKSNLADIQLLALDVDGVLTDGTVIINDDGGESKFFNSLDGHGLRMWQRAGLKVALISGRFSKPTQRRAEQLDIEYVFQDCHHKLPVLEKLLEQLSLSPAMAAYVGDDVNDLPLIKYVGFGVAVANAVHEVKQYADYVTTRPGGSGAVREVIEYILKDSGQWQQLMKRYLP
ncbi:MAG: HAD hydrolase family protein [Phycisphaerales bacterium]|jgi:3-deoxy-D-manno-octulosonate 8-phosphate phosphatase (KDO 8-P phosphatase)